MEISSWISHHANHSPQKTAIYFNGRAITYQVLEARVGQLAAVLTNKLGIITGERFAYLGENSVEMIELFFACARIGAIFVPLNARMTSQQHRHFLVNCEPRYLLVEPQFWLRADAVLKDTEIGKLGFGESIKACDRLESMINPLQSLNLSTISSTASALSLTPRNPEKWK